MSPLTHKIIRGTCGAVIVFLIAMMVYITIAYIKISPDAVATTDLTPTPGVAHVFGGTAQPATPTAAPTRTPVVVATTAPTTRPTSGPGPRPTATPVQTKPTATPTPCKYINCNPWGYNFTCCHEITNVNINVNFCSYFTCDSNFWNGSGSVVECQDGYYELRHGYPFSCAGHGGELRLLFAP